MDNPMTEMVLNYICDYIAENDLSPTQREIAKGCSIGKSTVEKYLVELEALNLIHRTPGIGRSIRIVESDEDDL